LSVLAQTSTVPRKIRAKYRVVGFAEIVAWKLFLQLCEELEEIARFLMRVVGLLRSKKYDTMKMREEL